MFAILEGKSVPIPDEHEANTEQDEISTGEEPSSSVEPEALENSFSLSCSVVDENQDSNKTDDIATG